MGKDVEEGLRVVLSLTLVVDVPLTEGVSEVLGALVPENESRTEKDGRVEIVEDPVRLGECEEERVGKGEEEEEGDSVTTLSGVAEEGLEGEVLGLLEV